jgi:transaldolase
VGAGDLLSRPFVRDGELAGLIERGIVGVTSNPTIFQKAIADGNAYDEQLRGLLSLEVDPQLAHNTQATIDEARRLHHMIDRPNLFVS